MHQWKDKRRRRIQREVRNEIVEIVAAHTARVMGDRTIAPPLDVILHLLHDSSSLAITSRGDNGLSNELFK